MHFTSGKLKPKPRGVKRVHQLLEWPELEGETIRHADAALKMTKD